MVNLETKLLVICIIMGYEAQYLNKVLKKTQENDTALKKKKKKSFTLLICRC